MQATIPALVVLWALSQAASQCNTVDHFSGFRVEGLGLKGLGFRVAVQDLNLSYIIAL